MHVLYTITFFFLIFQKNCEKWEFFFAQDEVSDNFTDQPAFFISRTSESFFRTSPTKHFEEIHSALSKCVRTRRYF